MANNKPIDKSYLVKQLKNYETEIIDKKYVAKDSVATTLEAEVTDEQVASALLAKTELDKKIDKTSIATTLSSDLTNDEVVGAKLAYDELQKVSSETKEQFNTASGESITVNDSVDGKIRDLKLYGKSEQKQYSGKNLLDCSGLTEQTLNGVTFTPVYENGMLQYIKANGTATKQTVFTIINNTTQTLTQGQYILNGCPSGTSGEYFMQMWNAKGDSGTSQDMGSGVSIDFTNESGKYNISIIIGSGITVTNVKFYPMLRLASVEDATYEPYVGGIPAPNPSYPQAITSVGDDGSLVVKSYGKNLIPYPYYNGSDTRNGITATVNNDDGSITLNGTATSNYFFVLLHRDYNGKGFAKQFRGKTITISGGTSSPVLSLAIYDENGNNITPPNNEMLYDFGGTVTITVPENACDMYSYYYCSSGAVLNTTLKPQLEVGEFATEYEPYKGSTTTIPLSEPLRAIGDVKDEITYQDGKWGVLRRTGKYVVDGTESWVLDSDHIVDCGISVRLGGYTNIFKGISSVTGNTKDMITDYLRCIEYETIPYYATSNSVQEDKGSGTYRTPGNIWISFGASDIEKMGITKDVDSVKAWLSSHNITFIYPLGTPTFEPFADQTLPYLSTYDGVTNISNDDALSAEMTVKYPTTDASGVGSQNESRIAELAKDTDDKFDDVNSNLVRVDKNTIANLCNGKNGNNIIIGQIKANTIYTLFFEQDSETGFNLKLNISDGVNVSYKEISPTYSKTKVICWFSNTYDGNIFFNGWKGVNQRNFMIVEGKFDEWIDYITPTGNSGRLNVDVAELKNDFGSTDISAIGDGTVTGAIDAVNTDINSIKTNSIFSRLVYSQQFATTDEQTFTLTYGHTYLVILGTHAWYGTDVFLVSPAQNTDTGSVIAKILSGATNGGNEIHTVTVSGNVLTYQKKINNIARISIYDLNWFDY